MNVLISVLVLALISVNLSMAEQSSGQQQQQQQLQQVAESTNLDRQGKSLSVANSNGNSNIIEHSSNKARIEQEKRQVQEFLTTKNLLKSIIKLLFGNKDEISATSRSVLGILGKVLDLLKNTFGQQRYRTGTARTIRDSAEDAANAGVSILQGYVRSMLVDDEKCVQRYLCQASREATRDGRDLGYVIASVGGYASSYLLNNAKSSDNFKKLYDATAKGRLSGEDCAKLYSECNEGKSNQP